MPHQPTESDEPDPAVALPSPAERPQADILIFDGKCRFCSGQVARLHRWDSAQRIAFLSLHDEQVGERFPDLSHDDLMKQMYLIDGRGRRFGGAAAFRELTRKLPRLYPLAPLMHVPFTLPLWQALYRSVAKRRYQLQGECGDGACKVHL
ncbi:MAG: DUF393 domain-containing protein [Pirellulaceae bacterium]|jgi:predicted DCC family thiol-disulfide oxidoreductase YuxK|nr:DUF393 domain-containing protein [Pirellulaceae bacterium]MDP7014272.1 DUF393 domain-containing protein [Pirellulaceae bacterium]